MRTPAAFLILILSLLSVAPARSAGAAGTRPFGPAAFGEARRDGSPVLLVVDDLLCSRCRRRANELLRGEDAAALGSRSVVVRIDRLERPDVADVYAAAAELLGEEGASGSWPLVALLTSDGRPLFATLSRDDATFAGSLRTRLVRLVEDYRGEPAALETKAGIATARLREAQEAAPSRTAKPAKAAAGPDPVRRALAGLREAFDARNGGFGVAPKTPPHAALRFLLAEHARSGDAEALRLLTRTLEAMAAGGLRDHIGGGIFHETADEEWRVPCFDQRLDDNALLLGSYARAHAATGNAVFRAAAAGIAAFAVRELQDPDGGFRAGLSGGGEGEEGRPRPPADDRVVAGWNGLMIGGLATSGTLLGRPEDVEAARRGAVGVIERLGPPATLRRYARGRDAFGSAVLEDYAYLAEGLLQLHEASQELRWRNEAVALTDAALARFFDTSGGGFFATDAAHGPLLVRLRDGYDGALPSPNGVLASVLLRLGRLTGEKRYTELGRRTLEAFGRDLERAPRGMETMAAALGELLGPPEAGTTHGPRDSQPRGAVRTREVRGAVTLEASLSSPVARPGELVEARVALEIAKGWSVAAHRPLAKDLVPLSVSVPGDSITAAPPRYPEGTAIRGGPTREPIGAVYFDAAEIVVPLRVRRAAGPGSVRLSVRFQPCDQRECKKPETVLLEVPITVAAP